MTTSGHRQPDYYQSSIETIDCILAFGYESAVGFCQGNILKYTMRYRYKGNKMEDLKKASWYMDLLWAIEAFRQNEEYNDWKNLPTARELLERYGRP